MKSRPTRLMFPLEDLPTEDEDVEGISIFRWLRNGATISGYMVIVAQIKFQEKLLFPLGSPLHKRIRELNKTFLDYVVNHFETEHHLFSSNFRFMSKATLEQLELDLFELTRKYRQRSYQDEALLPKDKLVGVKWLTLAAPYNLFGRLQIDD